MFLFLKVPIFLFDKLLFDNPFKFGVKYFKTGLLTLLFSLDM
jgi:hypothetical protein